MTNITKNKAKFKSREKARDISALLYLDSSPKDDTGAIDCIGATNGEISPAHDKDVAEVNKETGEIRYKKKHVHVIYVANNNVTTDQCTQEVTADARNAKL